MSRGFSTPNGEGLHTFISNIRTTRPLTMCIKQQYYSNTNKSKTVWILQQWKMLETVSEKAYFVTAFICGFYNVYNCTIQKWFCKIASNILSA